jgi:Flp pilus assembly protein TadG
LKTADQRKTPKTALGQEAAEFALLLPLLLLVLFGILDLGRLFHAAIAITNAAREGARYGIEHPAETSEIEAAVQAEAVGSGIDLADAALSTIAVSCPDGACTPGAPLRVEVTYQLALIVPGVLGMAEVEIGSYAEMMVP